MTYYTFDACQVKENKRLAHIKMLTLLVKYALVTVAPVDPNVTARLICPDFPSLLTCVILNTNKSDESEGASR
jgi:hypothetical protein